MLILLTLKLSSDVETSSDIYLSLLGDAVLIKYKYHPFNEIIH